MRLFVYGTLRDPDIRSIVLGSWRGLAAPALLRGCDAVQVKGASYPALRPRAVGCARGFILTAIDLPTLERVAHYEGDEYRVSRRQPLVDGRGPVDALIFLALRDVPLSKRPWRLEEWQRCYKRAALLRTDAWMARWRAGNSPEIGGLPLAWRQVEQQPGFDLGVFSD